MTDYMDRVLARDFERLPLDLLASLFMDQSNALRPIRACIRVRVCYNIGHN